MSRIYQTYCIAIYILIPLSTKIAIKMGRASDKGKDIPGKIDTPRSLSSESEDEDDIVDDVREETPDLYRNSSLGMCVKSSFHRQHISC